MSIAGSTATGSMPLGSFSGGSNQVRVRAYNERLVLSLVRMHGEMSKADITRASGLSAQTVSVIMRSLEKDGLLLRGEPIRGRVGQPSVPMRLNPDAVFSFGVKIGRRSADLVLMDFVGQIRMHHHETYAYPVPQKIIEIIGKGIGRLEGQLSMVERERIAGIGISAPFELWNWADEVGAPAGAMDLWRDFDLQQEVSASTKHAVYLQNDATSACGAELVFGIGPSYPDFVYFFIGSFIGGGIVLNSAVFSGRTGTAGAVAPLPVRGRDGSTRQLLDVASIFVLENMLKEKGIDEIACTSVNDAFVMGAWGKANNADAVTMLADGNGEFARAAGLEMDGSAYGMGTRSQRYAMIVNDGVVEQIHVEQPGEFSVSSADHLLEQL